MLLLAGTAEAGVKTARVFTHRMVLQRNRENPIWGTAETNSTVRIELAGHPDIEKPKAVRFAWNGVAQPNLVNSAGLPARLFAPIDLADTGDR